MIGYAISKNKVKIRLTEERWFHVIESHDNLSGLSDVALDAVNDPDEIFKGKDELIAVKKFKGKHIVALYKEASKDDGFIITAFLTSKIDKVKEKGKLIWKKH